MRPDRPSSQIVPARPRRRAKALLLGACVAAAGLVVAGCGGKIVDSEKAAIAVQYDVQEATGVRVDHVTCPSDVDVVAGNRFECRVTTVSGDAATAELEVLNDRADIRLIRLRKA